MTKWSQYINLLKVFKLEMNSLFGNGRKCL